MESPSHHPSADPAARRPAVWNREPLPHVKRIIAVASGKGGVGKSTTAVNLAYALQAKGQRVGLLDADIYGPSIPRMLGLKDAGKPGFAEGQMLPHSVNNILSMSIGYIMPDQAAVLRGPMIGKALQQMLRGTRWGTAATPLDTLLIDLPPGTGDVQLSLAQNVPLDGAIIVTTPQAVALEDARKAAEMLKKVNVPILGVIENMSWLDNGQQKQAIFGSGGGTVLAEELQAPLLAQIPLDAAIGLACDQGQPYALASPRSEAARAYMKAAEAIG